MEGIVPDLWSYLIQAVDHVFNVIGWKSQWIIWHQFGISSK